MNSELRFPHVRYAQACELLAAILPLSKPADQVIESFFKANRAMGSKDRGFAAETVYGCLRHRRELCATFGDLTTIVTEFDEARWLVAAYLLRYAGWSARTLQEARYKGDADALVRAVRTRPAAEQEIAVRTNISDDYAAPLQTQFSAEELIELMQAMNQPAPVDLRVNSMKTTREDCQQTLAAQGYECSATPFSPLGLRRAQRGPLFNLNEFKQGHFELQDEGSQLIGLLAEAKPRQLIVDFCAGAGGKSLLLAAQMQNKGSIIACDTAKRRLDNIRPRVIRAAVDNIRPLPIADEADAALRRYVGKADCVIVDAPCSGSGTWRRNPDMKWRPVDLPALAALQLRILQAASALVKPGGRLIYATCSLLRDENQDVVNTFLQQNPALVLQPVADILERSGVTGALALQSTEGMLQCLPHRHQTDGFFAAVMHKPLPATAAQMQPA